MPISRRDLLKNALLGSSLLGLRSLATGLPTWFLANPFQSAAQLDAAATAAKSAQYLVLNTSINGDPINCNAPGTYLDAGISHPPDPAMAPTPVSIGGTSHIAAKPWSMLSGDVLSRASFIHHSTLTNAHGNHPKVMELMGALRNQEMLVSVVARNLAATLATVQVAPMNVSGSEAMQLQGRTLPLLTPPAIRAIFLSPAGPLHDLQKMRDTDLNTLNDIFRRNGTAAQKQFLDNWAITQTEARNISQDILDRLSGLTTNTALNQITAAVIMIQMKISPVISTRISFGGDNHVDADLAGETAAQVAGVATIQTLFDQLAAAKLTDQVTFANMNVFGRTMSFANRGITGRDHLANHHVTLMIGKNVQGSVIGGVVPNKGGFDYTAVPIDSKSGEGGPNGDIAVTDGLASVGKTLGVALGVDPAVMEDRITSGKVITAALV